MPDQIDRYIDQFQVTLGPYGCVLNFSTTSPLPPPPGIQPATERVASIRMSIEHLKAMTYILRRHVLGFERERAVTYPVPMEVLNDLRIGREDWDEFWRRGE